MNRLSDNLIILRTTFRLSLLLKAMSTKPSACASTNLCYSYSEMQRLLIIVKKFPDNDKLNRHLRTAPCMPRLLAI